jgi:hypothetical protein
MAKIAGIAKIRDDAHQLAISSDGAFNLALTILLSV